MMKSVGLAAIAAISIGTTAQAQSQCDGYIGQTVAPKTLDQALLSLNAPAPKGEFETTAAYQARVASAGNNGPLVISKKMEDPKYLEYDADQQVFKVQKYLFDNTNWPAWEAFYHAKNGVKASTSSGSNLDIVISSNDTPTGTYQAQNGFGARTTVTKITRTIKVIFQGEGRYGEDLFLTKEPALGTIPMSVDQARTFRQLAKIAFVVVPTAPYVTRANYLWGETTIDSPTEMRINAIVLNADIQCALLTDNLNKVLAAFPTR